MGYEENFTCYRLPITTCYTSLVLYLIRYAILQHFYHYLHYLFLSGQSGQWFVFSLFSFFPGCQLQVTALCMVDDQAGGFVYTVVSFLLVPFEF